MILLGEIEGERSWECSNGERIIFWTKCDQENGIGQVDHGQA